MIPADSPTSLRLPKWSELLLLTMCAAFATFFGAPLQANETIPQDSSITHNISWLRPSDISALMIENSATDSTPGKLRTYRDAYRELTRAVRAQYVAYGEYKRLLALSESEVSEQFPEKTYLHALTSTATMYGHLRREALVAQDNARDALFDATDGRILSDLAIAELHEALGL